MRVKSSTDSKCPLFLEPEGLFELLNNEAVADVDLLEQGLALVEEASFEMPGLLTMRNRFRDRRPFRGLRISGCLDLSPSVGALIMVLADLGASVRWADIGSCEESDPISACLVDHGVSVFACAVEASDRVQDVIDQSLLFPGGGMPQILIDDHDESCLLSISRSACRSNFKYTNKTIELDAIEGAIDAEARQLLAELILVARWEIADSRDRSCDEHNMKIWVANPLVCQCESVVMLKSALFACA